MKTLRFAVAGLSLSVAFAAVAEPTSNIVDAGSKYSGDPKTWTSAPDAVVPSAYLASFDTRAYLEWLLTAPDPLAVPGFLLFLR